MNGILIDQRGIVLDKDSIVTDHPKSVGAFTVMHWKHCSTSLASPQMRRFLHRCEEKGSISIPSECLSLFPRVRFQSGEHLLHDPRIDTRSFHRTADVELSRVALFRMARADLSSVRTEVVVHTELMAGGDGRGFATLERTLPLFERAIDVDRGIVDAIVEKVTMTHDQSMSVGVPFVQQPIAGIVFDLLDDVALENVVDGQGGDLSMLKILLVVEPSGEIHFLEGTDEDLQGLEQQFHELQTEQPIEIGLVQRKDAQTILTGQRFVTFATEEIDRIFVVGVAVVHETGLGESTEQIEERTTVKSTGLLALPMEQIGFESRSSFARLEQILGNAEGRGVARLLTLHV